MSTDWRNVNTDDWVPEPRQLTREELLAAAENADRMAGVCHPVFVETYRLAAKAARDAAAEMVERG